MNLIIISIVTPFLIWGCSSRSKHPNPHMNPNGETISNEVVLTSELNWEPLNPARGDQSPRAATLWGDRKGSAPTGFLVKFKKNFSSPPHIHNITYRGVVIKGLIHNDDPGAADMWMPTGSFWTQPAGEAHITAAKDKENMAFIEIESGPYLVRPVKKAYDNKERAINIHSSNLVWLDQAKAKQPGIKIAYLWGKQSDEKTRGYLIKVPSGFSGPLQMEYSRAVIIQGQLKLENNGKLKTLSPGSYFTSPKNNSLQILCTSKSPCIIYLKSNG